MALVLLDIESLPDPVLTQICVTIWHHQAAMSQQYATSIGSDTGLVPNRWQAIIWTNYGLIYCHIYISLWHNELNTCIRFQYV